MNYRKENWIKEKYEEQMSRIKLEWWREATTSGTSDIYINRVIQYLAYTIEDDKNRGKLIPLKELLSNAERYKDSRDADAKAYLDDSLGYDRKREKRIIIDDNTVDSEVKDLKVAISVGQYDTDDNMVKIHTGLFNQVFDNIRDFEKYYYRVTVLGDSSRDRVSGRHFGVRVSSIGGLRFNMADYLNNYLNHLIRNYYRKQHMMTCDFFYIVNHYIWIKRKFQALRKNTREGFGEALNAFLKKYPRIVPVSDLNVYKTSSGIYLMVLDGLNACYLGQSVNSIKARVMRHWSRSDYFTGSGIDLFKALDTTRLYAMECSALEIDEAEYSMVDDFPKRYTLNVMSGGTLDYLLVSGHDLVPEENIEDGFVDYERFSYDIMKDVEEIKDEFIASGSTSDNVY